MNNLKRVSDHPDFNEYSKKQATLYQRENYDKGFAGYFLRKSHEWAETAFGPEKHFNRVLEVGGGTGMHIKYIRHSFDEYIISDLNPNLMSQITLSPSKSGIGKVTVSTEDATRLSFEDNSFDRVIAAHVLEHIYKPHEVILEWVRVLKPGGILTLILPCDPGALWRLGRFAMIRNKINKAGIPYDYWMAREHVNPINNLVSFIHYYFSDTSEKWLPTQLPSIDLNLIYIAHIKI